MRDLAVAAALGAAVTIPALAHAQGTPAGSFTARDEGALSGSWHANGTDATSLTVAPGDSVAFGYPSGSSAHNVDFTGSSKPVCEGLPSDYAQFGPGWSGTCRFDQPGTYPFQCDLHPYAMTGKVVVEKPAATATPTPTPAGDPATPTPTPTATTPTPGGGGAPVQTTLTGAVRLAARQAGARIRGAVDVKQGASRLEVTLWAPRNRVLGGRSRAPMRLGRWLKASAPAGAARFSVPLAAKARSALRRDRRLAVTVRVALTPPGGHKLTRSVRVTLRAG